MNMEGENTHDRDSYNGTMHMTGKSQGQDMDMKMTSSGKRIGGSCDTEELVKKAQAQAKDTMDKMCGTADFDTSRWISASHMYLGAKPACKGEKDALCDAVRKDAPRDADVYQLLLATEKNNGNLITKTCGLNMDATTTALCKTLSARNYSKLSPYCPAEAKAYKEATRKSGRDYSARSADKGTDENEPSKSEASKTGNPAQSVIDSAKNLNTDSLMDGAKKLKGMFGF